jgi:branched-chain amino acid aminotransferase
VETAKAGYEEAILLDEHGNVCEGSGVNIFLIRDGEISTPPPTASILDGITRRSVIQIAQDLGFRVVERDIARGELYQADELFLTGTATEMAPIREVDDHAVGPPGEITRAIQSAFSEAIKGKRQEYLEWLDFVELDAPKGVEEPVA